MDELIGRLASKASIDSVVAEKTIGIVLGFLRNEGPSDKVQALIDQIPGAEAAIAASSSNGGFSRLMGGGLMAVGTRLMALGLGMNEIQSVAQKYVTPEEAAIVIVGDAAEVTGQIKPYSDRIEVYDTEGNLKP